MKLKSIKLKSLVLIGFASLTACASADAEPQSPAPLFDVAEAQRRFDEMAGNYPAINVTVMADGEIVWEAEGGTLRAAEDSTTLDYNFYSAAKMLTGLAYAKLESQGKVNLDTPVRTIDTALPEQYESVTLRHLLEHTGGVRHYLSEEDWITFNNMRCGAPEDALDHFINDPLTATPGEEFQYSTYGFTLLSHLLVKVTGEETYDDAMKSALGSHYLAQKDSETANKAQTYMGESGAYNQISLSAECKFGGGGLIASARDLAAMGAALSDGEIVPLGFVQDNFVPSTEIDPGYVYGMGVGYSESLGTQFSMHSGGSPGGRSFLLVFYEPKVAVAFTSNFDGPQLADLSSAIGRIFSGAPAEAE